MATASTSSTNMSIENSSGSSTTEDCGAHVKIEEDFLNSGRTGRRNAIPDIYCPQSRVSTAELPTNFARLSCEGTFFCVSYRILPFMSVYRFNLSSNKTISDSGQPQVSSNANLGPNS